MTRSIEQPKRLILQVVVNRDQWNWIRETCVKLHLSEGQLLSKCLDIAIENEDWLEDEVLVPSSRQKKG